MSDLMAWNADATRLPYRMHSEYLRRLFLNNDLAEGRYIVGPTPVSLSDIKVPIFAVGTATDHVAPWRSTYKIHRLAETEVTYLLTTGGHNAGIVSEPDHRARSYQVTTAAAETNPIDPDPWLVTAPRKNGSWWPEWNDWLKARSGESVAPPAFPATDARLPAAPGTYVLQP